MREIANARALRRSMPLPEVLLWQALRTRPGGFKFRRQHPVGPFVLDFHCTSRALAIEVDGEVHDRGDRPARDARRDAWLAEHGIAVLRLAAKDVLNDLDVVVRYILETARGRPLHHASHGPPPQRAGEDL